MAKIHDFSKTLPPDEKFDMHAQIRRSSKKVTGNIGEAYGRYHFLDSLRFYSIACGELNETLARLIDARVLDYVVQTEFEALDKLIRKTAPTLNGYMNFVRRQRAGSREFGDEAIHEAQADYTVTQSEDIEQE